MPGMLPRCLRLLRIGGVLVAAGAVACGRADESPVTLPSVDAWPSPDPGRPLLERDAEIARVVQTAPALVDRLEFTDGRVEAVAVVSEDATAVEVWIAGAAGPELRRVPRPKVARVARASADDALRSRLERLAEVETHLASGATFPSETVPAPEADAWGEIPGADDGPRTITWPLDAVDSLGDLPLAGDVRWWPEAPSDVAGSAWEPEDTVLDRTGVWTLLATGLGHDASVRLQVIIDAERVAFEHSPGYWGAPLAELHGHWRVFVDGHLKWEYFADVSGELTQGRYPYEHTSITLGPGEHTVRWELVGCDSPATYFWAIDSIRWEQARPPVVPPTWGALEE